MCPCYVFWPGDFLLQNGKYKQASVQYKKIVAWLEHESGLSDEDEKKAKTLRLAAHLNLAMCFLKMHEPNKAFESCDKVFDFSNSWKGGLNKCLSDEVFALYRRELFKSQKDPVISCCRPWKWILQTRRLCSDGERRCSIWMNLRRQKMISSESFSSILPTKPQKVRYNTKY